MPEKPKVIQQVGFDFSWDEQKVWKIEAQTELMDIDQLTWHLKVPFLWTKPDGYYDLKPLDVIRNPEDYQEEYQRMRNADTTYPIDIMENNGRWVILDGLHRLMKQFVDLEDQVMVRKIPRTAIPRIRK